MFIRFLHGMASAIPLNLPMDQQEAIEHTGCAEESDALLLCYDEHGRDWRKCKDHLTAFRQCYERYMARRNSNGRPDAVL